jgi:DNA-binding MarR family transcriptional regulator
MPNATAPPPAPTRPEDFLGWRVSVAGRLVRAAVDASLAETGVGAQGLGVLLRLAEHDGPTQADLARSLRVEPPTLCRLLDRMERDGLVRRDPDPGDRRATRVRVTDAGETARRRATAACRAAEDAFFAGLDRDERATLADLLGRALRVGA